MGTDADFLELTQAVHNRGMRIIIDGVFNHCSWYFPPFDDVVKHGNTSAYADWFYDLSFPVKRPQEGEAPGYACFAYEPKMPKLNTAHPGVQEYFAEVGRYWIEKFHVDGWRLDVAADLGHSPEENHQFWRDFRKAVKEANPNAVILAEHYGDPKSWLDGTQWDTIMNYDAFMEPITWFLTGMEKHSDDYKGENIGNIGNFEGTMRHHMTRLMTPSLLCAMNELSNHDHSRFLTRTNHKAGRAEEFGPDAAGEDINKGIMKEAVVFQMTWPGAPTLYYGDEAGQVGFTDPDNRRTYPWGEEDMDLLEFHREIIRIHRESEALRTGSVKLLEGEYNFLCYARFNREDQYVVILNNDSVRRTAEIEVWSANLPKECELKQEMFSYENGYSVNPVIYNVEKGKLVITMPKYSSLVLKKI